MYDKAIIQNELISKFAILGTELGFSKPFVRNISGRETHVCVIRGAYALRMEIVWHGITGVFVNVVKPTAESLFHIHADYPTLDENWEPLTLKQLYHIPLQKHKKMKRAPVFNTWDEAAPYYFSSLDNQLQLIRSNPDILLTFIGNTVPCPSSQPTQREESIIARPHKRKTIALCILFAVVYCLHGVSGAASSVYLTIQTGTFYFHSFLGWYHILTVVLVAAFYLPLAFRINRLAKETNMRILKGFSVFFIIVALFFLTMNAIAIIVWLFNPGFFR